jgi:hypothetical protein
MADFDMTWAKMDPDHVPPEIDTTRPSVARVYDAILPTVQNTHQIAQTINRAARVVYVDNDRCKSGCAHAC